jgi:hypothetical protein
VALSADPVERRGKKKKTNRNQRPTAKDKKTKQNSWEAAGVKTKNGKTEIKRRPKKKKTKYFIWAVVLSLKMPCTLVFGAIFAIDAENDIG